MRYCLKITVVKEAVDKLHSTISTSVLANDDLYDAVNSCVNSFGTETDGQYVLNLYDIDAINFEDEWWNPSFAKSMTIDGDKLYVAVDHMNLNGYTWTDGMYFNKDLVVKLGLDMPYDLVREGKWTLDRMAEYMKPAINLNGDSDFEIDPRGNSIYGLCVQHTGSMMSIVQGAGAFLVKRDNSRIPALMSNTEHAVNVLEKFAGMLSEEGSCLMYNTVEFNSLIAFLNGRGMFYQGALGNSLGEKMRSSDVEYGVLPLPKYDENQPQYYSNVSQYTLALSIPKTVTDPEVVGACLDYLEYASYKEVIPVLQESLCYKGVRDDDSIDMYEIIKQTQYADIGSLFGWTSGFMATQCEKAYKKNLNFSSDFASNQKIIEDKIEQTLTDMGVYD